MKAGDGRVRVVISGMHPELDGGLLPIKRTVGLDPQQPYQVHELLSAARYLWQGPRNYVELDPQIVPPHIFQLRRRTRTERDFDYYM
jgi:starch synthase (maltosyl-transferring)